MANRYIRQLASEGSDHFGNFPGTEALGPNNVQTTTDVDYNDDTTPFAGLAYYFFDHAGGWDTVKMDYGTVVDGIIELSTTNYKAQAGRGLQTTVVNAFPDSQSKVLDENLNMESLQSTSVSTGTVMTSSDKRLKNNINTIDNAFEIVNSLRGVSWDWKKTGKRAAGIVAQELQETPVGYAVYEQKAHIDLGGKEGYLAVEYNCLWGYMIEAFKEQSRRVAQLQATVDALTKN